ncbi:olfactory receptor 1C1-like [Pseudophryne corroboree]|uniref:olfactory receptor 1C1-like n=1 Tax=Pseudophryne corroboree TaxID=495146 RepID=UPI003082095E
MTLGDCYNVTAFTLLGLTEDLELQVRVGVLLIFAYVIIFLGNFTVIAIFSADSHLHSPMYIFLFNLSIIDIASTSNILPKLFNMLFTKHNVISFAECITQMYFFLSLVVTELLLLSAMAYDRYVAICHPLNYVVIMSFTSCAGLSIASWVVGFLDPIGHTVLIAKMYFWSDRPIDHFFCDVSPLLLITCSDISMVEMLDYIDGFLVAFSSFLLILVSYIFIISNIMKIKSAEGKHKAFSTCTSHLTCVIIYYGTMLCLHIKPTSSYYPKLDKLVALVYVVLVPMLNPFIYCLKNKDIKKSLVNFKINCFRKTLWLNWTFLYI